MKQFLLMFAMVSLVGCGKKEPVQPSSTNPEATKPEPTKAKATAGLKLWEFKTGDEVVSSPVIGSDGTVYVGSASVWSEDNKLYAINGKSGLQLWEFKTENEVVSSPVIGSDGTVYVGSLDNKLYAIKTGSLGPAKSPWPMRGQNVQHTGRAPKKEYPPRFSP